MHLIAIAALLGSPAALAQGPSTESPGQPITVTGDKPAAEEKTVCKYTSTGTMLRKRICMPESEWARAEQNTEGTLDSMRDWQRVRCSFGMAC